MTQRETRISGPSGSSFKEQLGVEMVPALYNVVFEY